MNSEIDLKTAENKTPRSSMPTIEETLLGQAAPVANSTPIRTSLRTDVRHRLPIAYDSPFLRRIPRSLAHIRGRPGVHRQPSVIYESPNFLRRIPRTFSQIKGRPGIKMPRKFHPNGVDTPVKHEAEALPEPSGNASLDHLFEAELVDVEMVGSAVETIGSAVGVLGTAMTLLGETTGSEEQPQAVPAPENMTEKSKYPCTIL